MQATASPPPDAFPLPNTFRLERRILILLIMAATGDLGGNLLLILQAQTEGKGEILVLSS